VIRHSPITHPAVPLGTAPHAALALGSSSAAPLQSLSTPSQ
jgi:hypothetical protein